MRFLTQFHMVTENRGKAGKQIARQSERQKGRKTVEIGSKVHGTWHTELMSTINNNQTDTKCERTTTRQPTRLTV